MVLKSEKDTVKQKHAPTWRVYGKKFHENPFKVRRLSKSDLSKLGKSIALLRRERNLTQEQLAERAHINWRYLQKIEAGEVHPSLSVLLAFKKIFKCDWNDLLVSLP